jgi:hypothetical protein
MISLHEGASAAGVQLKAVSIPTAIAPPPR